MIREQLLRHRTLATKITLLVALMGVVSVAATAYALLRIHSVDQQYRSLIASGLRLTPQIGEAELLLSEAGRIMHAALFEPDAVRQQAAALQIRALESSFMSHLEAIQGFAPDSALQIGALSTHASALFAHAAEASEALALHRDRDASRIARDRFEPALQALREELNTLRGRSIAEFEASVRELDVATSRTIWATILWISLGLLLVLTFSIYVALTHVSRPMAQLTRVMEHLTARDYSDPIPELHRSDELGTMARALQVFKDSMQRADQLAIEVAASAETKRLSEQLMDLTNAIPGAVFQLHVRPDGWCRFLFVSDKAAQLPGVPARALEGTEGPIDEAYGTSTEIQSRVHDAFAASLRTLAPLDFDVRLDGPRWLRTQATARRTPDGGVLFNGVWLDVTDRRLKAQNLHEAKDAAEKAAEDRANFLAVMGHEIRNPLNAILGLTQLALKDPPGTSQNNRLAQMQRAGRHLLGILNDILDFSKIEGGHLRLETRPFTVQPLLADVVDLFAPRALHKGLALRVEVDDGMPSYLMGDPQRIAQILINYVHNAIKFTQQGEVVIRLRVTPEGGNGGLLLQGEVTDTGIGLTESQMSRLFQPFHQADHSVSERLGGTGLGLVISRQLAELMGGEAGVRSQPGQGSTFWFTARVQKASEAERAPEVEMPAQAASHLATGRRVLVVDDNALNLQIARGLLEHEGMLVDTASDGAQALEKLAGSGRGTYVAVLMDIQMPVMDGLTAIRTLRAQRQWHDLPIIAMTANATRSDIEAAYIAGVSDYLSKPLMEDQLWRALAPWLQPTTPEDTEHVIEEAVTGPAQAATQPASDRPSFDARALEELIKLFDATSLRALLDHCIRNCERRLALIQASAHEQDWDTVRSEAHALGGSVGSFGLQRLNDVAQALEDAARAHDGKAVATQVKVMEAATSEGLAQLRAMKSILGSRAA